MAPMEPVKKPPYRTPKAVSEAIKHLIQDKKVCELGCAEGDNLVFMSQYAASTVGFEYMQRRYEVAQRRGLNVVTGDYYKDPIPDADVYYVWPDDGEKDTEYLVQKLLTKRDFNGHIIVGADPGFPPEIPAHKRIERYGTLIEVPYNEGPGHRENGTFRVVVINKATLPQQCTLLLSSPRAGSSCTTGCFKLCDVSLGKSETTVKDQFNKKGYFENQSILSFNERVFAAIGTNIFSASPLNANQISKSLQFKDELVSILSKEYEGDPFFMIKDPRINILQELYLAAFRHLGIKINVAILRRDQASAAKSMNRMAGISIPHAESVYNAHYQQAKTLADKTNGYYYEIMFDQLLKDPNSLLKDACHNLEIPYGIGRHNQEAITQFVERGLVNFS